MSRLTYAIAAAVLTAACLGVAAYAQQPAQQPAPPPFATTKVEGTDNVYVFRYGNHQSMFVVTSAGVIATDPSGTAAHRLSSPTSTRSRRSRASRSST
jgi:hypothetical protein